MGGWTCSVQEKTDTNQYLPFSSHHPIQHKLGVLCILLDRCDSLVTEEDRKVEVEALKQALRTYSYPERSLNKVQDNIKRKYMKEEKNGKKGKEERNRGMVVVPYVEGLTAKVSRVFKKRRWSVADPIWDLVETYLYPKEELEHRERVYSIDCKNCRQKYIG